MNENITPLPLPIKRIDGATIEFRMGPNHVAAAYFGTEKNAKAAYEIFNAYPTLRAENARLREALRQYADKENWGYYDESGCSKGHGSYEDACFIGPEVARNALTETEAE